MITHTLTYTHKHTYTQTNTLAHSHTSIIFHRSLRNLPFFMIFTLNSSGHSSLESCPLTLIYFQGLILDFCFSSKSFLYLTCISTVVNSKTWGGDVSRHSDALSISKVTFAHLFFGFPLTVFTSCAPCILPGFLGSITTPFFFLPFIG